MRDQYEKDWIEWRAEDGAPFNDVDSNGVYDPEVDVPGIMDAIQTIWFVANDLDWGKAMFLYGTEPVGMEYQATIWEYSGGTFDNLFFRRYKLINKSNFVFDSMYISMWADPDIGTSTNDFVGCDTLLNLGFAYNASETDIVYDPLPPPAVGFKLIRGPLVQGLIGKDKNKNGIDDATDIGVSGNNFLVPGSIDLPMTAFYYINRGDPNFGDPPMGDTSGANQMYNLVRGRYILSGKYFNNPITSHPTSYAVSGDPVTQTGWVDGILTPPGDRRLGLSTGPFQMMPGEEQTIVFAEIAAGAKNGIDNIGAVSMLKNYSIEAQNFYNNSFPVSTSVNNKNIEPNTFSISQNYPNPFNPTTKIQYDVSKAEFITIKVYDIIGKEVKTLVNEKKKPGLYELEFNASDLSSGVYFYRIQAESFSDLKKMLLLK